MTLKNFKKSKFKNVLYIYYLERSFELSFLSCNTFFFKHYIYKALLMTTSIFSIFLNFFKNYLKKLLKIIKKKEDSNSLNSHMFLNGLATVVNKLLFCIKN